MVITGTMLVVCSLPFGFFCSFDSWHQGFTAIMSTSILGGLLHCMGARRILRNRNTQESGTNLVDTERTNVALNSQYKSLPSKFVVWLLFAELAFVGMLFLTAMVGKWTGSGLLGICGPYGPHGGLIVITLLCSVPVSLIVGMLAARWLPRWLA